MRANRQHLVLERGTRAAQPELQPTNLVNSTPQPEHGVIWADRRVGRVVRQQLASENQ